MINKFKKERGITLISLVVTIIVIIILAAISFYFTLGPEGIFKKASDAGKIQRVKNTQELLEVTALGARANTILSGENVVDEFLDILKKDNVITDNDIDNEYELFITVDELEFKIEEEEKNVKIIYQGEKGKIKPTLETCLIDNTTNSIIVEAKGRKVDSFNFYIKANEDEEYELKESNSIGNYIYEGLEQDKKYYIKVEAVNNNGKDEREYERTTGTVTAGTQEGAIVFSDVTWNSIAHTASVSLSTNTSFTIQYKKSGGEWTTGTTANNLTHGDTLYGRLWDGTNGGNSASVKIEDKIAPTITSVIGNITSSTIQVSAAITDAQSGVAQGTIFNFYIKKKTEADSSYELKQNTTSTTYTFTGLEQNIDYVIKVIAKDYAENDGEITTEVKTGTVAVAIGNITCSNPVWSNGKASVSLVTTVQGYTIQYKVNNGSWTSGTNVTNLSHGDTVYARLSDGTNTGSSASFTIEDSIVPIVTITQGTVTSNSINVSASATDGQSGMPTSSVYNFYIKKKSDPDSSYELKQNSTSANCIITGLLQEVDYIVKVTVKDIAENEGVQTKEIRTGTVALATGNITCSSAIWANEKASVTLSTSLTGYTIQYKVNNGSWTSGTNVTNLSHGDTVYARLSDGINTGSSASFKIEDSVAPTVTITQGTVTSNSINVSASVTDGQSGIPTSPVYSFYIKKKSEADSSYVLKQNNTSTSYTYIDLEQNVEYVIKVTVKDIAENEGVQTKEIRTGTVALATGNITCSSAIWANEKASVTLSTSLTGYTIQYKVNNGNWTNGISVTNLSHGDTVYARLSDGINTGSSASFKVEDSIAPIVTITQGTVTSNSINVSANATDGQSGIPTSPVYSFYIKKKSEADSSYVLKQNNSTTSYTFTGLDGNVTYIIKVTTEDNARNVGEKTLEVTTNKVLVTGINLDADKTSLIGGNVPDTLTITATITPSNAHNKSIQWSSSNTNVATVDQNGKVTSGTTMGTTRITATTKDGSNISTSIEIDMNKIAEYFIKDGDILTTTSFGTPKIVYEGYINANASSNTSNANNFGVSVYSNPLLALLYNKTAFNTAKNANKFYFRKINNYLNIHSELTGGNDGIGIILERGNNSVPEGNLMVNFEMENGSVTGQWAFVHSTHDASIATNTTISKTDVYLGTETDMWRRNNTVDNYLAQKSSTGIYSKECTIGENEVPALVVCGLNSGFAGVNIKDYYFIYGIEDYFKLNLNSQGANVSGTSVLYYKPQIAKYYFDSLCTSELTNNKISIPSKRGCIFEGYYTQPNGSGTKYIDGNGNFVNNTLPVITEETTLYANWIGKTVKITLNMEQETFTTTGMTKTIYFKCGTPIYYSDAACTNQITSVITPTSTIFDFMGYCTNRYNTNTYYGNDNGWKHGKRYIDENGLFVNNLCESIYEDTILYGHWKARIYAKVYTDGTLALSSTDVTISGKTLHKNYGKVTGNYSLNEDPPYSYKLDDSIGLTFIKKVIIVNKIYPDTLSYFFKGCAYATSIENISNIDITYVTDMQGMFWCTYALRDLDLSCFDTRNITDMNNMFYKSGIQNLNLSGFNTRNVKSMSCMFESASIKVLDLSSFELNENVNVYWMFRGCNYLETIYAGNWSQNSSVLSYDNMFSGSEAIVGGQGSNRNRFRLF